MQSFDAIVVGAGPAGSTAARHLSRTGARVLVLDRASFPREKPCGGGITFRADTATDLDLAPVTEREIHGVHISIKRGRSFRRHSGGALLARMTQRSRLDAHLLAEAAGAGAEVRDGQPVKAIEPNGAGACVRTQSDAYRAPVIIGADGVNGVTARSIGARPAAETAVALEANYPLDRALEERWRDVIGLDLAGIPGGYGWVFPKGDHLNVGVGGWHYTGPTLRRELAALCAYHALDPARLYGHRGYRLPLRRDSAPIVRGPVMLAGDAAALVDPLSGEGIWAAFVSGRLAAEHAHRYLAGDAPDLRAYQHAVGHEIHLDIVGSRRLQGIFQRLPSVSILMLKYNDTFWRYLVQIIRGDLTYPDLPRKLGPLGHALEAWGDLEHRLHARDIARRTATGAP